MWDKTVIEEAKQFYLKFILFKIALLFLTSIILYVSYFWSHIRINFQLSLVSQGGAHNLR
jgi:hypothetical protein